VIDQVRKLHVGSKKVSDDRGGFRSSGNRHAVSSVVGVLCCWRTINSDASRGKGSDPDCQLKPGVRSVPMIAVTRIF